MKNIKKFSSAILLFVLLIGTVSYYCFTKNSFGGWFSLLAFPSVITIMFFFKTFKDGFAYIKEQIPMLMIIIAMYFLIFSLASWNEREIGRAHV